MNQITKRRVASPVSNFFGALLEAFKDPRVIESINHGLELSKEAAARRSYAGKTQRALNVLTDPKLLAAAEVAYLLVTKGKTKGAV